MSDELSPSDRYVYSSGRVMYARTDHEGQILEANRAFRDEFGLSADHLGYFWDHLERSGEPDAVVEGEFDVPVGGAPMLLSSRRHGGELLFYVFGVESGSMVFANRDQVLDESNSALLSELTTEMGNLIREQRRINRELNDAKRVIEEIARTDALTGLHTRRHVLELAETTLQHHRRHDRPVSVLMADIDHFKRVNDHWGHQVGDGVLARVGAVIGAGLRVGDLAGRYGGEEFLVVLPESGVDTAVLVAERIRATLEELESNPRVTISIGVTAAAPDESLERVIGRADEALYEAKSGGRNRIAIASP